MGQAITHFMWGFQQHFCIDQEVHANAVFRLLDKRFEPEVFLIGILDEDRRDRLPACVEPEDDFWISSNSFYGVLKLAESLPANYPESKVLHSHPGVQDSETERLRRRAIHETVCKIIAECVNKPDGVQYFVSFPVARDGYLVSTVLGLQTEFVVAHPRLTVDRARIHAYRSFKAAVSLVDATVDEFLRDAELELSRPNAGEGLGRSARSPDELVRSAGARFTMDCVYKCDQNLDQIGDWQRFFEACNGIAALKYEQAAGCGRMVVARREHDGVLPAVKFATPLSIRNARGARKVLELAGRGLALHVNAASIFGLVEIGEYSRNDEDLFEVRVLGHHHWELAHAGQPLMDVRSGQPRLPAPPFDADKLRVDVRRIFPAVPTDDAERIVTVVASISTERHGTMIVVTADAAAEAKRLSRQSITIEPRRATPQLIKHLTPIDGAVLMSPDGQCYAIGVILDGVASPQGDPARGARYNSAVRYVQGHGSACIAIVVSEDGGVDLIPDLPSAIRRSEIESRIEELREITFAARVSRRRFSRIISWIERHAFYLLQDHCETVNRLVRQIDERTEQEDPSGFRIIRQDLVPNSRFDPAFYYEAE